MSEFTVECVSYLYNKKVKALSDVSFSIGKGDFLIILGPNGSGKSTLLGTISGVLKPSSGEVKLGEKNIYALERKAIARRIGFVPQNTSVDFPFTCRELVLMGRYPHLSGLGLERSEDLEIAEESMRLTETLDLADRLINQVSGGERQRVFIAQALAARPEILILDEPVSALDIKYKLQVMDLLAELNRERKITIITVLHDLNLAAGYGSSILFMKKGKVHSFGPPEEVLRCEVIREVFEVDVDLVESISSGSRVMIPYLRKPADISSK